ncbi:MULTISPECIES: DUF1648 domain-containing protein [Corynebacterium]|uniref:DUF1648 domain-containing protein n=1 Tax=Corynebacterium TaxID=1716 RepID=UPI00124C3B46|nr:MULTISPECIES: DUF1648 domain-containing protein [Corynebacterium]
MSSQLPRRPFLIAYLLLPLAIMLPGLAWILLALLPELPATIATHWGLTGPPNNFGSPLPLILILAGLFGPLALLLGGLAVRRRVCGLGGATVLSSGFMLALLLDVLLPQRGLDETELATVHPAWLPGVITMLLSVFLAALLRGWVRRQTIAALHVESAPRVWEETTRRIPWGTLLLLLLSLLLVLISPATMIFVLGIIIATASLSSRTRIELHDAALILRSPELMVFPYSEIHHVEILDRVGFWDYGGYGINQNGSDLFVIPGPGNAVRVHLQQQRATIVVPEGQAAEIAAEINARLSETSNTSA